MNKVKAWIITIREYLKTGRVISRENVGYKENTQRTMLLFAHSLEKGICVEKPRINFGREKAIALIKLLDNSNDAQRNTYTWNEAYCSLGRYINYSEQIGSDVKKIKESYQSLVVPSGAKELNCGVLEYDKSFFYGGWSMENAKAFIRSRRSVRKFQDKKVAKEVLSEIIRLALMAPSACNRQPSKVYVCEKEIEKIKKTIPGNKGFEDTIPNWLIVTEDRNLFGWTEVMQCYVNGGIFVNQLVMAFHCCNVESCIFQIPIGSKEATEIRQILGIPDNEAIVAAVGFGYIEERTKVLCAERKAPDEIIEWR